MTLRAPATTTGMPRARSEACTTEACLLVRTRTPISPGPIGRGLPSGSPSSVHFTRLAPDPSKSSTSPARSWATNFTARSFCNSPFRVRTRPWSLLETSRTLSGAAMGAPSRPGRRWAGVAYALR